MYALDQTLSQYEARRAAGVELSSSAPLLSVDEGLVPLHTADDLVQQYNCGDLNLTLFASVDDEPSASASGGAGSPPDVAITSQINDYFRSELIDKRNRRMAVRIDRLLTDRPDMSFFFAFGAGMWLERYTWRQPWININTDGHRISSIDYTEPSPLRHTSASIIQLTLYSSVKFEAYDDL